MVVTHAEHKSKFKVTKDTSYLALGALNCVYLEDLVENVPHHNGTALYIHVGKHNSVTFQCQIKSIRLIVDTRILLH